MNHSIALSFIDFLTHADTRTYADVFFRFSVYIGTYRKSMGNYVRTRPHFRKNLITKYVGTMGGSYKTPQYWEESKIAFIKCSLILNWHLAEFLESER